MDQFVTFYGGTQALRKVKLIPDHDIRVPSGSSHIRYTTYTSPVDSSEAEGPGLPDRKRMVVEFDSEGEADEFRKQVAEAGEVLVDYGTSPYENGYPVPVRIIDDAD